jgi:hypothetical protein
MAPFCEHQLTRPPDASEDEPDPEDIGRVERLVDWNMTAQAG